MRFRTSHRSRQPTRIPQTRIVSMLMLLALVAMVMQSASKPSSWYWLTGSPDGSPGMGGTSQKVRFQPELEPASDLAEDEIRVVAMAALADGPDQAAASPTDDLQFPAEMLALIRDNSVGVRPAERDIYYRMLAKTRDTRPERLEKAASDAVAFSLLMTESQRYIGKLLTVRGEIRRVVPLSAGPNEHGIGDHWEVWLFNRDSGMNPYCLRMTSLPPGLPTGQEIPAGTLVTVTGYFFKRYGYQAPGFRLHLAPMILAKSLTWHQKESLPASAEKRMVPWILGGISIVGSVLGLLWLRMKAGDRRFERETLRRLAASDSRIEISVEDLETVSIDDFLKQLSAAPLDAEESATQSPPPDRREDLEESQSPPP